MAIVRWNPWSLSSLFDEDWNLPSAVSRSQGLNIYETENALVAEIALPGIPEDKVDVSVDNSLVRISGSMEEKKEETKEKKYFMSSMASSYNYSFRLPENVKKEPEAILENGVLTLTFPKTEESQPKKIKVVAKKKE